MSIRTLKSGWLLRQSTVLKRWKKNWFILYADGNFAYYEDESLRERHGNFSIYTNGKKIETALECSVEPPEGHNYGCLLKLVGKNGDDVIVAALNSDEALAWKLMLEEMIVVHQQVRPPVQAPSTTVYTTSRYPYRGGYRCPGTTTITTYYPAQPNPAYYPTQQYQAQYPIQRNIPPPGQTQSSGKQVQQPMYYNPTYGTPMQVMYNSAGQPYYINPNSQVVTVIQNDDPYYYRRGDMFWGVAAGAMLGAALWSPFFFF